MPTFRYGSDFPRSLRSQFERSKRSGEFAIAVETLSGVRQAISRASIAADATPAIKKFSDRLTAYASGKAGSRSLSTTNERLAEGMRSAVLESYTDRVLRQKKHPSYRVGDRYSGGALARALRAPGMFVGSYNGIAMGDTRILSQEAKHWARLNYGAGGKATSQYAPATVNLSLFGQPLGVLTDATSPRPAFSIPIGIWVGDEAEGGHFFGGATPGFYPLSKKTYKVTKGIAARRFFDAGLVYLGANMTPAYEDLMRYWERQASQEAQSAPRAVKVSAKG